MMNIVRLKFPHFNRIISAGLLWTSLGTLLFVNMYARVGLVPPLWPQALGVLSRPLNLNLHLGLAARYRDEGWLAAARRELLVSQELYDQAAGLAVNQREESETILGVSTTPQDLLTQWEGEPDRLEKDFLFWKNVVKEKPIYRDGLIQTAVLAYQLGYVGDAQRYIQQAALLDQTSALIQDIQKAIGE